MIDSHLSRVLERLQETMLTSHKRVEFVKAFERISSRYRSGSGLFLQTQEERLVYLLTRLPGTFSAITKVLKEMKARNPSFSPKTLLDVGAGPGTGMWATFELFPELMECTLLEKDLQFMNLGKSLTKDCGLPVLENAHWKVSDLEASLELSTLYDLVLLSYSIGEIQEKFWLPLFSKLWEKTGNCLVVIEPGTPSGYQRLMKIREILKKMGGYLWAPCPHNLQCPLAANDWCHFSVRVQRTSLHRQLKSADLSYEDEKFCYLIFGKNPLSFPFSSRIIRHPMKHSGHTELTLCKEKGIEKKIFSKKDKEVYKQAKKLEWGDCL